VYLDESDPDLLVEYGERLGNRAVFKRLGFVAEALDIGGRDFIAACQDRLSAGIASLDPDGPDGGRRVMRWGLFANVTIVRKVRHDHAGRTLGPAGRVVAR
jgi:predicted transcriptional regulator of viral defense system